MPMKDTFTPLLTFNELSTFGGDLFSDAFGFDIELGTLLPRPEITEDQPSDKVLAGLFEKISHDATVH